MADTSMIDLVGLIERTAPVRFGKAVGTGNKRTQKASCPFCKMGTDRFAVFVNEVPQHYHCGIHGSGCGAHGDAITFLREWNGLSYYEACEALDVDPGSEYADGGQRSQRENKLPLFLLSDEPPNQKWQDAAAVLSRLAERCLWGPKGTSALNYLRSRGFKDDTIKQARLGLCPDWHKAPLENWGLSPEMLNKTDDPQIKIPRGIVIPYYIDRDSIHKIQLRRPDGQYFEVLGSSECPYSVDPIEPGRPVLLVESEFDALSAHQEASDLVVCVATGGTPKGRTSHNVARLMKASTILQGFDDDKAGEDGAEDWLKRLPKGKATRWAPFAHDVNDMLREGLDIRDWIEIGLQVASVKIAPEPEQGEVQEIAETTFAPLNEDEQRTQNPLPTAPPALYDRQGNPVPSELAERVAAFQESPCTACGGYDWMIDHDGLLACPCLVERRKQAMLPRPQVKASAPHPCPHCAAKGRLSVGGVELVRRGQTPWASTFKKTPGQPFVYVWIESQGFWVCPGCQDIQVSMPADMSYVHMINDSEQGQVRASIDSKLEPEAQRIAAVEHLPIAQARYWARTRTHLESVGYYDHVKRDRVELQARIAAYHERIGKPVFTTYKDVCASGYQQVLS